MTYKKITWRTYEIWHNDICMGHVAWNGAEWMAQIAFSRGYGKTRAAAVKIASA